MRVEACGSMMMLLPKRPQNSATLCVTVAAVPHQPAARD
jgi:hypothetical protein